MAVSLATVVRVVHLIALALGVGAATAKNLLLLKCKKDPAFAPAFLKVQGIVTAQIIVGQALLTLSGIAYAYLLGYGFTPRVIVKVVLVAMLWVLGPFIDNAITPAFRKTVPAPGHPVTPDFVRALNRYLFWDVLATGLFYAIIIAWSVMA